MYKSKPYIRQPSDTVVEKNNKIVVVIPTHNNDNTIGLLITLIHKQRAYFRDQTLSLLIVDNASTDKTLEIVNIYAMTYPRIQILQGKFPNKGKALIRGYRYAMRYMPADYIVTMDADLSHDPSLLPFLIRELISDNDLAIGSRYVKGSSLPRQWSGLKVAAQKGLNRYFQTVAGLKSVEDVTGSYRAIRTSVLRQIQLDKLSKGKYSFQVDLLRKALSQHAKVTEFPIQFVDTERKQRRTNKSSFSRYLMSSFRSRYSYLFTLGFVFLTFLVSATAFFAGNIAALFLYNLQTAGIISNQILIFASIIGLSAMLIIPSILGLYLILVSNPHRTRA